VGCGDCLKQREAQSSRWPTGVLSLQFTPASRKLSADEKARGRSGNILVAVLAASVELGRKGSGEGGNAVRWSGGGGKQQQVVLACWFREEEEMERRGWVGQGKWATRKGNETESDEEKKQWPVREKSTARLMRGIQTRFK
jgi:hypothetical protein